jgi:two-component system, OmpR family, sensor kinase
MTMRERVARLGAGLRGGSALRTRIRNLVVALLALTLVLIGVLNMVLQLANVDQRITDDLEQEVAELQALAGTEGAVDRFPSTAHLLSAATEDTVPSAWESVVALRDEQPLYRPVRSYHDLARPEVREQILAAGVPGRTVYTTLRIDGSEQRAAIASVTVPDDPAQGWFVVASDVTAQRGQVLASTVRYAVVAAIAMVVAGLAANRLSARIVRPLEDVTSAASEVTIRDLGRRVPVPGSGDEVQELAEGFNRMLDRLQDGFEEQRVFLNDVSHELRTPLTIVRGNLELLSLESDDPAVLETRDVALDEVDRMTSLVGDLSVLAQSQRPDFVRLKDLDVEDLARDVHARASRLGDRVWRLDCRTDGTVRADPDRIPQALLQLIQNAVKYSADGTAVTLEVVADGPDRVRFSVLDQGRGIATADQERVFERFVRVGDTDARPGSGLGLAIVARIAAAHGGHVAVDSTEGVGSRFSLTVPRVADASTTIAQEARS